MVGIAVLFGMSHTFHVMRSILDHPIDPDFDAEVFSKVAFATVSMGFRWLSVGPCPAVSPPSWR